MLSATFSTASSMLGNGVKPERQVYNARVVVQPIPTNDDQIQSGDQPIPTESHKDKPTSYAGDFWTLKKSTVVVPRLITPQPENTPEPTVAPYPYP